MEKVTQEIKYCHPLDLIPYENNPRVNDYAVKKVQESIKEFGFRNPILVDTDMVIIAGHTRREASILEGLEEVPYIVAEGMSPEQVKAYRIADNKLGELATWDEELLKEELWSLQEANFNVEVVGFEEWQMDTILNPITDEELSDFFTESEPQEKEPKTIKCPHCGEYFEV